MRAPIRMALVALMTMPLPIALHAQDAARAKPATRGGVLRPDLVGKLWTELPKTRWPHYALPMPWKTEKKYLLRYYRIESTTFIVTVLELPPDGAMDRGRIVSAIDLRDAPRDESPEHDCYYVDVPPCDGRLCEGLLLGLGRQPKTAGVAYKPSAVWKITTKTLRFEKVPTARVRCKVQDYET